jgi:hypothetical protein
MFFYVHVGIIVNVQFPRWLPEIKISAPTSIIT